MEHAERKTTCSCREERRGGRTKGWEQRKTWRKKQQCCSVTKGNTVLRRNKHNITWSNKNSLINSSYNLHQQLHQWKKQGKKEIFPARKRPWFSPEHLAISYHVFLVSNTPLQQRETRATERTNWFAGGSNSLQGCISICKLCITRSLRHFTLLCMNHHHHHPA